MKKNLIIITVSIVIITTCIIVFIWFGIKPVLAMLGLSIGGGLLAKNRKMTFKEVNRIIKKTEDKNEKINNGDNDAIRDAFDSIGGSENKRD